MHTYPDGDRIAITIFYNRTLKLDCSMNAIMIVVVVARRVRNRKLGTRPTAKYAEIKCSIPCLAATKHLPATVMNMQLTAYFTIASVLSILSNSRL